SDCAHSDRDPGRLLRSTNPAILRRTTTTPDRNSLQARATAPSYTSHTLPCRLASALSACFQPSDPSPGHLYRPTDDASPESNSRSKTLALVSSIHVREPGLDLFGRVWSRRCHTC